MEGEGYETQAETVRERSLYTRSSQGSWFTVAPAEVGEGHLLFCGSVSVSFPAELLPSSFTMLPRAS